MSDLQTDATERLTLDDPSERIGMSRLVHADCFDWLKRLPPDSLSAVVTAPPYGVKEYNPHQIEKRAPGSAHNHPGRAVHPKQKLDTRI